MRDPFNILVAGVGGQGNLVCGRVLAQATLQVGLRPVVGDTFGASRRGGSVLTHLRIGKTDWAPLIPRGEVDILLGLDLLESVRASVDFGGERSVAVVSTIEIPTLQGMRGKGQHPTKIELVKQLERRCKKVYILDTEEALKKEGSRRSLNTFMLGALSVIEESPFPEGEMKSAVEKVLGSEERNTAFFELGAKICREVCK